MNFVIFLYQQRNKTSHGYLAVLPLKYDFFSSKFISDFGKNLKHKLKTQICAHTSFVSNSLQNYESKVRHAVQVIVFFQIKWNTLFWRDGNYCFHKLKTKFYQNGLSLKRYLVIQYLFII